MHMQLRGAKYKLKYSIRYSDWWKFYSYYFASKSANVEKNRHFDLLYREKNYKKGLSKMTVFVNSKWCGTIGWYVIGLCFQKTIRVGGDKEVANKGFWILELELEMHQL